jgi:hypothetical protein
MIGDSDGSGNCEYWGTSANCLRDVTYFIGPIWMPGESQSEIESEIAPVYRRRSAASH